jgi:hypothetical protein
MRLTLRHYRDFGKVTSRHVVYGAERVILA